MTRPLFTAPDGDWTGVQTLNAFADSRGRRVAPRHEDGSYSFEDGTARYRLTLFGTGDGRFVWGVVPDEDHP